MRKVKGSFYEDGKVVTLIQGTSLNIKSFLQIINFYWFVYFRNKDDTLFPFTSRFCYVRDFIHLIKPTLSSLVKS